MPANKAGNDRDTRPAEKFTNDDVKAMPGTECMIDAQLALPLKNLGTQGRGHEEC